jgi:cell shape-determining protein MreC
MLIRISLILAIIAALGAGAVNFFVVKDKLDTLVKDRNDQRDGWTATKGELDKTKKKLASTQNELSQTQQQLTDAQAAQKNAEDIAAKQTKVASNLSDQLTKTKHDLDDANNGLAAYKATGITADQVGKLNRSLKEKDDAIEVANQEKAVLQHAVARLTSELDTYRGPDNIVKLRADLKGKIVVVDPKWDFVVLNIGENQGVLPNGELLVSRDGKLVAKVIVRTLEKDRSIANVVPGWKLGEVIEGDEVSPAHPAS